MASGFSADEVPTMSREALHALSSEKMVQSPHLRWLLSVALSSTWAATQGVQEVAATRRGSQAGEPHADLASCMLMQRILQRVRDRMDDLRLVVRLLVCTATSLRLPISYVDDASAYTWGPDAQTAIDLPRGIRVRRLWPTRRCLLSSMGLGLFRCECLTLTSTWVALWLRAVPSVVSCKPGSKP